LVEFGTNIQGLISEVQLWWDVAEWRGGTQAFGVGIAPACFLRILTCVLRCSFICRLFFDSLRFPRSISDPGPVRLLFEIHGIRPAFGLRILAISFTNVLVKLVVAGERILASCAGEFLLAGIIRVGYEVNPPATTIEFEGWLLSGDSLFVVSCRHIVSDDPQFRFRNSRKALLSLRGGQDFEK
jgi:hypothetical protein